MFASNHSSLTGIESNNKNLTSRNYQSMEDT